MALAWPAHDAGPTPPPDHEAAHRRDGGTRKPLPLWDRGKFLWAFALLFAFLVWRKLGENPLISVHDAALATRESTTVLQWLAGLELLRQLHYLVSERSARWHHLVSESIFGRWNRFVERRDPWTRFRAGRVVKVLALLAVVGVLLGVMWDVPWYEALFDAPGRIGESLFSTARGLPLIFQVLFGLFFAVGQFVAIFWFMSRGGVDVYRPDDIETRFSDVWGQDPVLTRVQESIVFLERPKEIEDKGGHVPGGILLWGPPGTGKTLLAEAVAGETGRPFVFVDPGAFQAMFMGVGILKVKALYRKLRRLALRYGGVIVFFDEADSLGNRGNLAGGGVFGMSDEGFGMDHLRWLSEPAREAVVRASMASASPAEPPRRWRDGIIMGGFGSGGMGTLQALLTEMSGLKKPRGWINRYLRRLLGMRPKPPPKYRILTMMATNLPQALDEALLRPGRLDRIYKVGYPSKDGRKRTYQGYFDKVSHELTDDQLEKLAVITPYATGATIKDLVNESLITAIRDGRQTITWADVIKAKHLKTLGPGEDVEYVNRERHAIAIHEACHAVAAYRLRRHLEIDIATIEKGGTYLGMVSSIPPDDQFTRWRSEYEVDIKVSVASLAGERLFFGRDNSSGVSGDLDSATTIATLMEGFWGMGETLVSYRGMQRIFGQSGAPGGGGGGGGWSAAEDDGGDDGEARRALSAKLGERVESNLRRLFDETEQLLQDNRGEVLAIAHALETYKTLSGEDVAAVMEGTVGPLVDGRIYRTQEFLPAAERYHAVAAEAHAAHGHVPEEIPDWRPPPPPPVELPPVFGPPAVPPSPPPGANGRNGGPHPAPAPPPTGTGSVDYPTAPPTED